MRDDLDDYRILWRLEGEPCEVYLFRRWGGYTHPVLPGDPLTHADALRTPSLCRAFVREIDGEPLMVRFSAFAARDSELTLPAPPPPGVYSVELLADGSVTAGKPLDRIAAAMTNQMVIVEEGTPDSPVKVTLRQLRWAYTYDYTYNSGGVIEQVNLSDDEGSRALRMHSSR